MVVEQGDACRDAVMSPRTGRPENDRKLHHEEGPARAARSGGAFVVRAGQAGSAARARPMVSACSVAPPKSSSNRLAVVK